MRSDPRKQPPGQLKGIAKMKHRLFGTGSVRGYGALKVPVLLVIFLSAILVSPPPAQALAPMSVIGRMIDATVKTVSESLGKMREVIVSALEDTARANPSTASGAAETPSPGSDSGRSAGGSAAAGGTESGGAAKAPGAAEGAQEGPKSSAESVISQAANPDGSAILTGLDGEAPDPAEPATASSAGVTGSPVIAGASVGFDPAELSPEANSQRRGPGRPLFARLIRFLLDLFGIPVPSNPPAVSSAGRPDLPGLGPIAPPPDPGSVSSAGGVSGASTGPAVTGDSQRPAPSSPGGAAPSQKPGFPERPEGAATGDEFTSRLAAAPAVLREEMIIEEILKGNVPGFMRTPKEIPVSFTGRDGIAHTGTVRVLPDYLCVGSDENWVRVPMSPRAAQLIADRLGCHLPTRKIVDRIYEEAEVRLQPIPMTPGSQMTSVNYFVTHDGKIDAQIPDDRAGLLVAGHKKDVVVTNRMAIKPRSVAIYGWHTGSKKPIQPLSTVHEDSYSDYSHGIRLLAGNMTVDGREMAVRDVLTDPGLCGLLSDEGPITARYRLPGQTTSKPSPAAVGKAPQTPKAPTGGVSAAAAGGAGPGPTTSRPPAGAETPEVSPAGQAAASATKLRRLKNSEITATVTSNARRILKEHFSEPYGTEIPFDGDGRRYVARLEKHYHEPGGPLKPWGWHKGVSVLVWDEN